MDERLRELERRAAAGDPAALEQLQAARRRAGRSLAAKALLEAHRAATGREHDPQAPVKLSVEQAAALIEAMYLALGWRPASRMKGKLVSPDGERRLVWNAARRTLRRERRQYLPGSRPWTRDERSDAARALYTVALARRLLDEAAQEGRVAEEAIECGACAGWGWVLLGAQPDHWFRALVRCAACERYPDDDQARERALSSHLVERGEPGWRERRFARRSPQDRAQEPAQELAFQRFVALLDQGLPRAGLEELVAPEVVLELRGERERTLHGLEVVAAELSRDPPFLERIEGTRSSSLTPGGEVVGWVREAQRPSSHLGRLGLTLVEGRITRIRIEVARREPAPAGVTAGGEDRELVEALARLERLSPLGRVFVQDVRRAVLSLGQPLTAAQRARARELLAR